jgi:mRNA interferase HigB
MHVVTPGHLDDAAAKYPDAAKEIAHWMTVVEGARWTSFVDVRRTFLDADEVDGYVVFNIRHNRYRLITVIHYSKEKNGKRTLDHIYIRSLLTHREYDNRSNWDREFGTER